MLPLIDGREATSHLREMKVNGPCDQWTLS